MKKNLFSLLFMAMAVMTMASCSTDKKGTEDEKPEEPKTQVQITKMSFASTDYAEWWKFEYNTEGKVSKVTNSTGDGTEWADIFAFDYTTAGQITVTREDNSWIMKVNAEGYVTEMPEKLNKGAENTIKFTYTPEGYMSTITQVVNETSANELVTTYTYKDGNAISYDAKGEVKQFTYSSGENVGGIYQALNDNYLKNWQLHTGLFGKPCVNINTKLVTAKGTTTEIKFAFNEDGSAKTLTRNGSDWEEVLEYEYQTVEKK